MNALGIGILVLIAILAVIAIGITLKGWIEESDEFIDK